MVRLFTAGSPTATKKSSALQSSTKLLCRGNRSDLHHSSELVEDLLQLAHDLLDVQILDICHSIAGFDACIAQIGRAHV